jgi:integrase
MLWEIPKERMKKRLPLLVPLAPQTVAILEELKELSRGSEFVFPGRSYERPMSNHAVLGALGALGYAGRQSVHGFRHIASTALNEAVDEGLFHADAVERQLAHVKRDVRGRYNKALYLPLRRTMMAWYADRLDERVKA